MSNLIYISTDILYLYTKYLSNNDLINFIINKSTYKKIKNEIKKRYFLLKIQKFIKCWLVIKENLKSSNYIFSMINYKEEIIIEILASSPHNKKDTFRECINYTKESKIKYWFLYHLSTKWYNKKINTLKTRVFKLIINNYEFDNNCVISKEPNFKNLKIL